MPIPFSRLQEYLDLIAAKSGQPPERSPHKRFWSSYEALTQNPLPNPKCNGADIFAIKYIDAAKKQVDADNSPLYMILVSVDGFCNKDQMPPGGPFILDQGYTITLSDGTVVSGDQIKNDIHDWLSSGAKNIT